MKQPGLTEQAAFFDRLGLSEEPLGVFFDNRKPDEGYTPDKIDLPTREKEEAGTLDWKGMQEHFSCAIGHIRKARKNKKPAYFSKSHFGCAGAAFWMGFNKPQIQSVIHYVSTGVPGRMDGEHYCDSPERLGEIFNFVDPVLLKTKYCIFKQLSQCKENETPELVTFFVRPEVLSGLHQLAAYVTGDPEVVVSPWSSACGSLVAWPLYYLDKKQNKAVLGGWDPSARKFFKTDELTITIPFTMYLDMVRRYKDSFMQKKIWDTVKKRIHLSRKKWKD